MKPKGFTLIEILLVMAIIGILATIITPIVSGARAQGRDAQRISQLKQIRYALEAYNDEFSRYPVRLYGTATTWTHLERSTYMYTVPRDPYNNTTAYTYVAFGDSNGNCTSYHIGTLLEKTGNEALKGDEDQPSAGAVGICSMASVVSATTDFSGTSRRIAPQVCDSTTPTASLPETCLDFSN